MNIFWKARKALDSIYRTFSKLCAFCQRQYQGTKQKRMELHNMIKRIVCSFAPSADPLTPRTPVRLLTLSGPASTNVTSRKEVLRKTRIAIATMVLTLGAVGLCSAQQPHAGRTCIERIRDIDLTEAQEATIAGIQDEYAPKVEEAVTALKSVIDEELDKLRAVLTPEQLSRN